MVKKAILHGIVALLSTMAFAQKGVVLVGIEHPFHVKDNITLPRLADSLNLKSNYVDTVSRFSTGMEMLKCLKTITDRYGAVGNVVFYGHSGYEGYFVKQNAGFHRDRYYYSQKAKNLQMSKNAAFVSDLKKMVDAREVIFHPRSVMVLAGCNTAYGEENIALDLADALNIPVAGSNQKVDLYNVKSKGEDLKGTQSKTFFVYIPLNKEIIKYDLERPYATVTEIITITNYKVQQLIRDKRYTSCFEQ